LAEQAAGCGVSFQKSNGRRIVDAEPLQQIHHSVAALHTFFAQKTLVLVSGRARDGRYQLLDHLLPWYVRREGTIHGAERGNHAEKGNAEHANACPDVTGSQRSVLMELR
jgi:hypothetical protein